MAYFANSEPFAHIIIGSLMQTAPAPLIEFKDLYRRPQPLHVKTPSAK